MSKQLLDFISGPESGGNYNAYYGNSGNTEVPLTQMSLRDVIAFQKQLAAKTGSSAAGRYQFLSGTLEGLVQEKGLSLDATFNEALQDELGMALLERRGLSKWRSGKMSLEDFGNSLASEWAGLPLVSGPNRGRSKYDGDSMGNSAGVSADDFVAALGATAGGVYVPPPTAPTLSAGQESNYSVPNAGLVQPNVPFTDAERRAQAEEGGEDTDMWTLVQDAVSEGWSMSWLLGEDNARMAPDPEFRLDETKFAEASKDIPEEYWDRLGAATSDAHLAAISQNLKTELERSNRLTEAGPLGLSLRLAAGFTDPLAWAVGAGVSLASSGAGLPAVLAAKFGKMGLVAEGAVAGAIGNTLSDAIIEQRSEVLQPGDLIWSAGLGAAFGGAFGALARNPHAADEARMIERAGKSLMNSTRLPDSSAGAMFNSARQDLRATTAEIVRDGGDAAPEAFAGNLRFDLSGQLKSSKNLYTRMLGNVLVEDGTRNAKGVTPIGASELQQLVDKRVQIKWRKGFDKAWADYSRRNKVPLGQRDQALADFSRQVTSFARDRDPMVEYDPAVAKAGGVFREIMAKYADLAADPGQLTGTTRRALRGAEAMRENRYYVPRIFDHGAIQNALVKYGHANLTKFLSEAILAASPKMERALAAKFAKGYLNRMHKLSAGELLGAHRAFSGEDLDELRTFLEGTDGITAEDIDAVVEAFTPKPQDGAAPRMKHRQLMDENFTLQMPRSDGSGVDQFRMSDLFVNDADFLLTSYSRQMSGRVALANTVIRNPKWREGDEAPEFFVDGITSDGEWATMLDEVKSVADSTGSLKNLDADIERLQFVYNSIIGRPNFDEGKVHNQLLRMARDYNFLRVMNQVGFAQLSEVANATSQLGWKAMLGNMPSLRSLWRNAKTGQIDDALAAEIEDLIGSGTDWLRHTTMTRMDEFGNPLGGIQDSGLFQSADRLMQKGKKVTAAISGMAPVNTLLQRWTGRAIFQKFAQDALKGTKITRRMQALGLSEEMLGRVQAQFRQHATYKGKRLQQVNHGNWDDQEALAAFEHAAFRLSRTIIQENDLGQMNAFMSSPVMRTLLQFRSFTMAAWSKQFLQGINMHDWQTASSFMTSIFVAGLAYTLRTAANSVGRDDQAEYLADRLSLPKLAAASMQNSSWFSLLAPAIDSPWTFLGNESFFTGRSTQLNSNIVTGNPTMDLFFKFQRMLGRVPAIAQGDANEADYRNLWALLPFQNALGISNAFNAMISHAPD